MIKELERKYKVVNMMTTMHSILRAKYKARALLSKVFFLITAIILNMFTFFDFEYLDFLNFEEGFINNVLNLSSVTIFFLSVIYIFIDWGKKVEKHEEAINQLSRLLNEIRIVKKLVDNEKFKPKVTLLNEMYNQTFEIIHEIPENKFNKLKAKHYHKVELSKYIDLHKGKPYIVIYILFTWENLITKWNRIEK